MSDEELIRNLVFERHKAILAGQADRVEQLLHEQYFYIGANGQSFDKATFLASMVSSPIEPIAVQEIVNFHLQISDSVATASYHFTGSITLHARTYEGVIEVYHTLIKVENKWLFLAGHFGRSLDN